MENNFNNLKLAWSYFNSSTVLLLFTITFECEPQTEIVNQGSSFKYEQIADFNALKLFFTST